MMNWNGANDWGWGVWVVMCTMMVVFWAAVIWVVLAMSRRGKTAPGGPPANHE